jgi:hypothetical protein
MAINELQAALTVITLVPGVLHPAVAGAPPGALPLPPLLLACKGGAGRAAVRLAAITATAKRELRLAATALSNTQQLHRAAACRWVLDSKGES